MKMYYYCTSTNDSITTSTTTSSTTTTTVNYHYNYCYYYCTGTNDNNITTNTTITTPITTAVAALLVRILLPLLLLIMKIILLLATPPPQLLLLQLLLLLLLPLLLLVFVDHTVIIFYISWSFDVILKGLVSSSFRCNTSKHHLQRAWVSLVWCVDAESSYCYSLWPLTSLCVVLTQFQEELPHYYGHCWGQQGFAVVSHKYSTDTHTHTLVNTYQLILGRCLTWRGDLWLEKQREAH